MKFLNLKKGDSKLKLKVNDKDKIIKRLSVFSKNLSKESEFYIKNNLIIFMILLLSAYNYDITSKVLYLPFLLGQKFLRNVGLITNLLNDI
jgi:hypothetical protein|tara:strand:+ start:45 stop:317 length:273 start_codon:yes stop_codon:yes gene_type:complete